MDSFESKRVRTATPEDSKLLARIRKEIQAAQEEEDAQFKLFRIPLQPLADYQMARIILDVETMTVERFVRWPKSGHFHFTAWKEAASEQEIQSLLWVDDVFKSSPLGHWIANYASMVIHSGVASYYQKWDYANRWLRREIKRFLYSIMDTWNASHNVFHMSWNEDAPYSLRIDKVE